MQGRQTLPLEIDPFSKFQVNLYSSDKPKGRFRLIPICTLDIALDTLKLPVFAIAAIAMAPINLIAAAFSNEFKLKNTLKFTEMSLSMTANVPASVVMIPIKTAFQFFNILIKPKEVQSVFLFSKDVEEKTKEDPHLIRKKCNDLQKKLYSLDENKRRIYLIPISILDIALDTLKLPVIAITSIAMAAIHLVKAGFSEKHTLKAAVVYTEIALLSIANVPVKLIMTPIKIAFQFFNILIKPKEVSSVRLFIEAPQNQSVQKK